MGFLHKLWDETLAGPMPDTGLGKLRKYNSFSPSRSSPSIPDQPLVSRSITIRRISNPTHASFSDDSPVGFSSPGTPLTPGTTDLKRFTWRKWENDDHQSPSEPTEPTSPTIFDWIVITALDR